MLVRSAPLDGGAISTEQFGGTTTAELGSLLDAAPRAGLDLPCRSGDADLWFAEAPAELERAKVLCGGCPIRSECLTGALSREEPWGVWGGELLSGGRIVFNKRPGGRPPKRPRPPVIVNELGVVDTEESVLAEFDFQLGDFDEYAPDLDHDFEGHDFEPVAV